ncbi:hypothetical protein [Wolbachia endosymbiont of Bemisia tabaci]|uniref:hypothetical protein n=1 Tax=Wolbachia endosymbiont of Bemisia tabaci TaxID=215173 RepID=UPI000D55DC6B|nr:hypothetical protein [Wolbachia endosymbiont of Bemisia tabaci]
MYICLLAYSIVSALGVLAWWLSFNASSPLAIGAIAGSMAPALIAALHVGCLLYKFCKRDSIEEDHGKIAIFLGMAIPISTMIGAVLNASVIAVLPNPVVTVIILVSATTGLISTIIGFYVATSLVHCVDETAMKSAVSAILIADSTYVKISQEEEVYECITFSGEEVNKSIIFPEVEKLFSARETAV